MSFRDELETEVGNLKKDIEQALVAEEFDFALLLLDNLSAISPKDYLEYGEKVLESLRS